MVRKRSHLAGFVCSRPISLQHWPLHAARSQPYQRFVLSPPAPSVNVTPGSSESQTKADSWSSTIGHEARWPAGGSGCDLGVWGAAHLRPVWTCVHMWHTLRLTSVYRYDSASNWSNIAVKGLIHMYSFGLKRLAGSVQSHTHTLKGNNTYWSWRELYPLNPDLHISLPFGVLWKALAPTSVMQTTSNAGLSDSVRVGPKGCRDLQPIRTILTPTDWFSDLIRSFVF